MMSTEIKYYSNESEKSMDIETIKKDFLFTIDEEFGCVYYLPQKRLAKIDRNTAKNLKDCQDGKTELTDAYENLLEKFKKNQSVSEDNVKVIHKLEIMVCTICNLNCVYCYANGGNYYGEEQMLSYEVVDALVRYLKQEQIKVEMVQFFGGEPALGYKMISYICKKFKENEESVENRVAIALTENPQNEIAVLALADYEDETISIDEIYCILSEGQTDLAAKINMEDQMKLIKYCEKNNKIPVVIHSHLYAEKEVSFSTIDLNFEHEFHHVQEILNYSVNSVFIVYGKTQSYARLCLKNKSMPFLMEDQINCITYREGSI